MSLVLSFENARLLGELESRNRDLTEALEQQTATADILRIISTSPTDLQPVLETVARSAVRYCGAHDATIFQVDDGRIGVGAHAGPIPALVRLDAPPTRGSAVGRAILDRRTIQVADLQAEETAFPAGSAAAKELGHRMTLTVPLLRQGAAVGAIQLRRTEVNPFTDKQIALLRTFADQAVIAIENVRLFRELGTRNAELTETLEQQTATSKILGVISRSPTDLQPVFDAIAGSARRLCDATYSSVHRRDGGLVHLVAHNHVRPEAAEVFRRAWPMPLTGPSLIVRAIAARAIVHVEDMESDPTISPELRERAKVVGNRSNLVVPMLRDGEPIGTVRVSRETPGPLTDRQIALLRTFADQAVIAIENVRLFKELEALNCDLTESLDRQTATAEILRAISQAQADPQPVFEAIADSAMRLFGAWAVAVVRYDGELVSMVVARGGAPGSADTARDRLQPPHRPGFPPGLTVLTKRVHHVVDVETDPSCSSGFRRHAAERGLRSFVAVPMLRGADPLGIIVVSRAEAGGFSSPEIALLQTFSDQAVIAVENTRLLAELQARNAELTESLARQTATGDILRAIAAPPTDVQPVFDAIALNAVLLCGGVLGTVFRFDGELMHVAALHGYSAEGEAAVRRTFPRRPDRGVIAARAVLTRSIVLVPDVVDDPEYEHRSVALAAGWRSVLAVPMLRGGEVVGTVSVQRALPGAFKDQEVALLQTFADQAVIAIENARLLIELQARTAELQRSVRQLTALGEVGQAVSSSLDLETVLTTIVARAVQLTGVDGGVVFEYDEAAEEFEQRASTGQEALVEVRRRARFRKGEGVVGRTAITLERVQVPDITRPGAYESRLRETLVVSGVRALLAVPMLREGNLIGSVVVARNAPGEFPPETVDLSRTFATQSALAIQNARLFRQIEVANRHKSEFLASMSHELRTPSRWSC